MKHATKAPVFSASPLVLVVATVCAVLFIAPACDAFVIRHGLPRTTALSARDKITKSDDEWRSILTQDQFYVLREEGTEPPNSSQLNLIDDAEGTFICAACKSPLFPAEAKFDSGTGWPSFYAPVDNDAVAFHTDFKLLLPRTECRCATCDGHLGHMFDDGPDPTGQRFCMNGVAMEFSPTTIDEDVGEPYKPSAQQVLPTAIFNAFAGALAFNSLLTNVEQGITSPLAIGLPSILATYCGLQAARALSRL